MEMRDLVELVSARNEASRELGLFCRLLMDDFFDDIKDKMSPRAIEKYNRLHLAFECAEKDIQECLTREAEMASFKD